MKKILTIILSFFVCTLSMAQTGVNGRVIPIRLMVHINSDDDNIEDVVAYRQVATVASDVMTDDAKVIIKGGTNVLCNVKLYPARNVGKPGKAEIYFLETFDVDNNRIGLMGSAEFEGRGRRGPSFGLAFGLFPLIGPFSFFFFGLDGQEADVPMGTIMYATTTTNM